MGVDTTTYIGAYLLVKDKTEEIKKEDRYSLNESTGKKYSHKIKFDPKTGEKLVEKVIEHYEEKKISGWWDFWSSVGEGLGIREDDFCEYEYSCSPEGYSVLLPNGRHGCMKYYDSGRGENDTSEIKESDIEQYKSRLLVSYKYSIEAMREFYGEVEVKFGVVTYSN